MEWAESRPFVSTICAGIEKTPIAVVLSGRQDAQNNRGRLVGWRRPWFGPALLGGGDRLSTG